MLRVHLHFLIAWRVLNAVLLIGGFVVPWSRSDTDPAWTLLLFTIYLPILLIAEPVPAVVMISLWLAIGYLVVNMIGIVDRVRALGWPVVIVLLGAILGSLLPILRAEPTTIGIGYYFLLFGLVSSSYLETIAQVSE